MGVLALEIVRLLILLRLVSVVRAAERGHIVCIAAQRSCLQRLMRGSDVAIWGLLVRDVGRLMK